MWMWVRTGPALKNLALVVRLSWSTANENSSCLKGVYGGGISQRPTWVLVEVATALGTAASACGVCKSGVFTALGSVHLSLLSSGQLRRARSPGTWQSRERALCSWVWGGPGGEVSFTGSTVRPLRRADRCAGSGGRAFGLRPVALEVPLARIPTPAFGSPGAVGRGVTRGAQAHTCSLGALLLPGRPWRAQTADARPPLPRPRA